MTTETVSWHITVPKTLDEDLRRQLGGKGQNDTEVARFVERTIRKAIFRQMLAESGARNTDLSEQEAMTLVDEAVAEVRVESRREQGNAAG